MRNAQTREGRAAGVAVTVALHALALTALMSYAPARSALLEVAPIMVQVIAPPQPEAPVEIAPPPPKPRPRPKRVVKRRPPPPEPPVLAAPAPAPSPVVATEPAPPAPEPEVPVVMAPPAPPPPVPVSAPIFSADYLQNPPPAYPRLSRRAGEEGRVVLRVLVNASGSADEVEVRASSGHARLDDAARAAVQRWRFVPAKRGEQPVAAWVLIPISFRLEG